jgi:FAD/FMN-containing dehydrogenase
MMGAPSPDLESLKNVVVAGRVIEDPDLLTTFEVPERGTPGSARFVVEPGDVDEVSSTASWAYANHARLVVQGANTGLVGASTPDQSGSQGVLGLSGLDRLVDLSLFDRTVVVESGMRLDALNEVLAPEGLFFPIELGANPSVGGLVATNAGGARTVRYGDTASRVVGIEGVLADERGSSIGGLSVHGKDNSRLRLGRLLVGSFGALGVVTRVALRVAPRPTAVATAMIVPSSHHDVLSCFRIMEETFGEQLSAFEFISGTAMGFALENTPELRRPFSEMNRSCYVLVEVGNRGDSGDLEDALAEALNRISLQQPLIIEDAVIAPPAHMWALRHSLTEGVHRAGAVIPFDVSVPRELLPVLTDRIGELIKDRKDGPVFSEFGHWGDGGTHLQLIYPGRDLPPNESEIREQVYDLVVSELGGSFSAEHGVGPNNADFYRKYIPEHEQQLERRLKRMLDPRGVWGTDPFVAPVALE